MKLTEQQRKDMKNLKEEATIYIKENKSQSILTCNSRYSIYERRSISFARLSQDFGLMGWKAKTERPSSKIQIDCQ